MDRWPLQGETQLWPAGTDAHECAHVLLLLVSWFLFLSRGRRWQRRRTKSPWGWRKASWTNSSSRLVPSALLTPPYFCLSLTYFSPPTDWWNLLITNRNETVWRINQSGQNLSLYLISPGLFFSFQSFHQSCPPWRALIWFIDDAVGVVERWLFFCFNVQTPSLIDKMMSSW